MTEDGLAQLKINVLLARFAACRSEIDHRSNRQLGIVAMNATAIAAIGGWALTANDVSLLILISLISPVLGLSFLDHDLSIKRIGGFIRADLSEAMHILVRDSLPEWEAYRRDSLRETRLLRLLLFGLPILMVFAIVPLGAASVAALDWYYSPVGEREQWIMPTIVLGLLAVLLFAGTWTMRFFRP